MLRSVFIKLESGSVKRDGVFLSSKVLDDNRFCVVFKVPYSLSDQRVNVVRAQISLDITLLVQERR